MICSKTSFATIYLMFDPIFEALAVNIILDAAKDGMNCGALSFFNFKNYMYNYLIGLIDYIKLSLKESFSAVAKKLPNILKRTDKPDEM